MAKTREQKRIENADKVCRELRYQIVKYGLIGDWDAINKHFNSWMNTAKKSKYERPQHYLYTLLWCRFNALQRFVYDFVGIDNQ